eukprot:6480276-Amphidinium_carterae.1
MTHGMHKWQQGAVTVPPVLCLTMTYTAIYSSHLTPPGVCPMCLNLNHLYLRLFHSGIAEANHLQVLPLCWSLWNSLSWRSLDAPFCCLCVITDGDAWPTWGIWLLEKEKSTKHSAVEPPLHRRHAGYILKICPATR